MQRQPEIDKLTPHVAVLKAGSMSAAAWLPEQSEDDSRGRPDAYHTSSHNDRIAVNPGTRLRKGEGQGFGFQIWPHSETVPVQIGQDSTPERETTRLSIHACPLMQKGARKVHHS